MNKKFLAIVFIVIVLLVGFALGSFYQRAEPTVPTPIANLEATMAKVVAEMAYTPTPLPVTATPIPNTPIYMPTVTPMSTVTIQPTEEYFDPAWRSAFFLKDSRAYEFSGKYNQVDNMILSITEIAFFTGDEIIVHKNRIQVNGGRVYLIIGPTGAGLYVNIHDVKLWNE